MLTSSSPLSLHFAQNAALLFTSWLFLPLTTAILLLTYIFQFLLSVTSASNALPRLFSSARTARHRARSSPDFHQHTILVTGVGMTKGLSISRTFYLAGHRVIGADVEPYRMPVIGRFSNSLYRYYALPAPTPEEGAAPYISELVHIIQREKVDTWVSCSGVASAVSDGQAQEVITRQTECKCIQFDVKTTETLHEKDKFIAYTRDLGLPVPETHNVTSRAAVHRVLHASPRTKKRYIMKSVGVDDAMRGDMTVLPKRTMSETYGHVARIPIDARRPWVLQQFVKGREYCTHALVIDGVVKAFLACPSAELLMHYQALPAESALSQAMLRFTQEFVARSGRVSSTSQGQLDSRTREETGQEEKLVEGGNAGMTGHLSFDFLIEESVSETGFAMSLVPIECNPRAHTAVALFRGREVEMANAYLSVLSPPASTTPASHAAIETETPTTDNNTTSTPNGRSMALTNGLATPPSTPSTPTSASNLASPSTPRFSTYDTPTPQKLPSYPTPLYPSSAAPKIYWSGHDIVTLLLLPLLNYSTHLLTLPTTKTKTPPTSTTTTTTPTTTWTKIYPQNLTTLLSHILLWKEGTYEFWDPLPWWWMYAVYWPARFAVDMFLLMFKGRGKGNGGVGVEGKWSRINVSTAKVFGC